MKKLYIDIETTGINPYEDRITVIGCVSVIDEVVDEFAISGEEKDMIERFNKLIENYEEIITWNGFSFDIPFIKTRAMKYGIRLSDALLFNHHDKRLAFEKTKIGFSYRRPNLSEALEFLGIKDGKTGDGKNAIKLWYEGKIKELEEYCIQDAKLVMEIDTLIK